ncbi:uncharacterized protein TrAtP1_012467 [Trichoderma atroviride]|uniref:uncharacterized protein n=1 Tax=Hypocrea atroviridis TaxID=63577 RepID=UPI0033310837|nr:hypothetical protein TrAtP1_012467 [Trichoderma atroviride]
MPPLVKASPQTSRAKREREQLVFVFALLLFCSLLFLLFWFGNANKGMSVSGEWVGYLASPSLDSATNNLQPEKATVERYRLVWRGARLKRPRMFAVGETHTERRRRLT